MLNNDSIRINATTGGFQIATPAGQGPRPAGTLEPQDMYLDSRGMLVAMQGLPSVSDFASWNFVV